MCWARGTLAWERGCAWRGCCIPWHSLAPPKINTFSTVCCARGVLAAVHGCAWCGCIILLHLLALPKTHTFSAMLCQRCACCSAWLLHSFSIQFLCQQLHLDVKFRRIYWLEAPLFPTLCRSMGLVAAERGLPEGVAVPSVAIMCADGSSLIVSLVSGHPLGERSGFCIFDRFGQERWHGCWFGLMHGIEND